MAKGNIFMGTLKGRVGASVFYVKQGEQNQIKHQTEVSNPKTSAQCYQRSRFASAGKFFTHGTQALFKFAFESKKKGESDFNAFMKANIGYAFPMSKYAIDNPSYPMVNEWLVTRGSLITPESSVAISDNANTIVGSFPISNAPATAPTTVGEVAKLLVDGVNYKDGDIITWLLIHTYVDVQSYPAINPDILLEPQVAWIIKQIRLSSIDGTLLSSQGLTASVANGKLSITLSASYTKMLTSYVGGACIHSRNTASGLKVSTNRLQVVNNDTLQYPMSVIRNYVETDAYLNQVIPTWQGASVDVQSSDIILGGALVSKSSVSQSGNNPTKAGATAATATQLILDFDPREGYLVATEGKLTASEAVTAANAGEVHKYYYNRVTGSFVTFGAGDSAEEIAVDVKSNGTFGLFAKNDSGLYYYISSWTNSQGQTIEFEQAGE